MERHQQTQGKSFSVGTGCGLVAQSHHSWSLNSREGTQLQQMLPGVVDSPFRPFKKLSDYHDQVPFLQTLAMCLPTQQVYITGNLRKSCVLIMRLYKIKFLSQVSKNTIWSQLGLTTDVPEL